MRESIAGGEGGFALVICLLALVLMSALGAGLVMSTSSEALIAGNFRRGVEARAAASAVVERAMADLTDVADWSLVLNGAVRSTFSDGLPGGRVLPDRSSIDLDRVINLANCGGAAACTSGQMDALTAERPWGANNPRWMLFASGPLSELLAAGRVTSNCYGLVLVADDQSENDGNPLVDGADAANPGRGVIVLRGESFCSPGIRHAMAVTVERAPAGIRVTSWRDLDRLDRP